MITAQKPNLNKALPRPGYAQLGFSSRTYCAAQKVGTQRSALDVPRGEVRRDVVRVERGAREGADAVGGFCSARRRRRRQRRVVEIRAKHRLGGGEQIGG